jgi:hypothetical protein
MKTSIRNQPIIAEDTAAVIKDGVIVFKGSRADAVKYMRKLAKAGHESQLKSTNKKVGDKWEAKATTVTATGSKKFNEVRQELQKLGIIIKTTEEHSKYSPEYVVKHAGDKNPDHGYFTNDLEDAYETGKDMAKRKHGTTAAVIKTTASDAKPELYDPVFANRQQSNHAAVIASADQPKYSSASPPKSPLSGRPMQLAQAGTYGQAPFKIWVHLEDRIVLPYRE